MKSIRVHMFGGPEVMKLEDLPDPVAGAGQVVVKVEAVGVNPVDVYVRSGKYGPRQFPYTPGTDAAGVVESIGPGVKNLAVNQRVYVYGTLSGAYAQKLLCTVSQAHALPDRVSAEQGAAIGVPFGTAYRAMFIRGRVRPGQSLLVHGASGGVGTAAVQLGRNAGMTVIGTAGTAQGLELVRQQGAHYAVNHHDKDYLQQIVSATAGAGVDLIIEMLANENLDKDLGILAKGGCVVIVGNRGRVEIDARQTMARDADIRGMSLMHADEAQLAMIHAALGAGLANGTLTPVVGQKFPLGRADAAHEAVMTPGAQGKIVLMA